MYCAVISITSDVDLVSNWPDVSEVEQGFERLAVLVIASDVYSAYGSIYFHSSWMGAQKLLWSVQHWKHYMIPVRYSVYWIEWDESDKGH